VASVAQPPAAAPARGTASARRFTPQEFRDFIMGKSAAELQVLFGMPVDKGYKSLSYTGLNIVDPANGQVYRNANIGFDADGGAANYAYLRE
jgi:hypothetical protein